MYTFLLRFRAALPTVGRYRKLRFGKHLHQVGARGFEPPASWSRTKRSSQAELRPESH
jgi:hypothetical protein